MIPSDPTTKVCSFCHQEQALDAFSPSKQSRDGRQSRCKSCERERTRARLGGGLAKAAKAAIVAVPNPAPLAPDYSSLRYNYSDVPEKYRRTLQDAAIDIKRKQRRVIEDLFAIGRRLLEVKDLLPPGGFEHWVKEEFELNIRMVYNMMAAAQVYSDEKRVQRVAPLSDRAIYMLAAPSTPEEARIEVEKLIEETGKVPTSDSVMLIIRKFQGRIPADALAIQPVDAPPEEEGDLHLFQVEKLSQSHHTAAVGIMFRGELPVAGSYIVYALVDPRDESVFYVGATDNFERRMRQHCTDLSGTEVRRVKLDLVVSGHQVIVRVLARADSLEECRLEEMKYIDLYRATVANTVRPPLQIEVAPKPAPESRMIEMQATTPATPAPEPTIISAAKPDDPALQKAGFVMHRTDQGYRYFWPTRGDRQQSYGPIRSTQGYAEEDALAALALTLEPAPAPSMPADLVAAGYTLARNGKGDQWAWSIEIDGDSIQGNWTDDPAEAIEEARADHIQVQPAMALPPIPVVRSQIVEALCRRKTTDRAYHDALREATVPELRQALKNYWPDAALDKLSSMQEQLKVLALAEATAAIAARAGRSAFDAWIAAMPEITSLKQVLAIYELAEDVHFTMLALEPKMGIRWENLRTPLTNTIESLRAKV